MPDAIETEIARIRGLADKATDAVWVPIAQGIGSTRGVICTIPTPQHGGVFDCADNKAAILDARTSVPRLCAALAEAVKLIEDLRTVLGFGSDPDDNGLRREQCETTHNELVLTRARIEALLLGKETQ